LTRSQLPPAFIYQRPRPNFADILSSTFVTSLKFSALLIQQESTMRFAIGATYALAAAVVRADDASAAEAESSTSTTVAKPTFTVRGQLIEHFKLQLTGHV
jgi:hypothetical protein